MPIPHPRWVPFQCRSPDVDAFLPTTSLTITKVWRRGDLRGHPAFIQDSYPHNGVVIDLSPSETLSLCEQDRIATEYLEHNEEQLKHIAKFPGVETFTLALQSHVLLKPGLIGWAESFSLRLLYFALRIGISPNVYVNLDWSELRGGEFGQYLEFET